MSSIIYVYGLNAWRTRDKWLAYEAPPVVVVDPGQPPVDPGTPVTTLGLGLQPLGTSALGGATV